MVALPWYWLFLFIIYVILISLIWKPGVVYGPEQIQAEVCDLAWPGGGRLALLGIIINIEGKRPHRRKTSWWTKVKSRTWKSCCFQTHAESMSLTSNGISWQLHFLLGHLFMTKVSRRQLTGMMTCPIGRGWICLNIDEEFFLERGLPAPELK